MQDVSKFYMGNRPTGLWLHTYAEEGTHAYELVTTAQKHGMPSANRRPDSLTRWIGATKLDNKVAASFAHMGLL